MAVMSLERQDINDIDNGKNTTTPRLGCLKLK
jgi:hypothetical protein